MSLINKMLQDLEDRGPEAAQIDSLYSAIRPAPARRGIHLAWFVAIALIAALALALAGFSWHRMRAARIAEIPLIVQQSQLPLKMADSLSIPAPQAEESHIQPSDGRETNDARAEPSSTDKAPVEGNADDSRNEPVKDAAPAASPLPPKLPSRSNVETTASSKPVDSAVSSKREKAVEQRPAPPALEKTIASASPVIRQQISEPSPHTAAKQVLELSPHEKAENEYRKAAGLIQQGRSAEATAALERSLTFDPRHVGARQVLIGLLLDARRTDDAMSRAKEGLALDGTQTGLAMILARLQVEKGDLQAAIGTLQRSLPSGAENAEYQAFYAALMQRSGNHKEAIAHYEIALRAMPQNGVWWMGMGISLQAENRLADARNAYARAKSSGTLSPALIAFIDQRLAQLQR